LAVRAYDGQGQLQENAETVSSVGTAVTGLYKEYRTIPLCSPEGAADGWRGILPASIR
jgi:hypothetical protein